jgi:phosphopantothenate-cysteine ligase
MVAAGDPESFFATSPPLRDASAIAANLQEFVARNSHASSGSRALAALERARGFSSNT